jgi:hypothetical protein
MIESYQSGAVLFRTALESDDDALKAALRNNAMDSWVCLSFEREPSYFDGVALMGQSYTVIACDKNQPEIMVGMYSCAFLPVHINGTVARLGYLGCLRVNPPYRHKIRILKGGFNSMPILIPDLGSLPFWFTSVASENVLARRVLETGLKGMPIYQAVGEVETLAINTQQGRLSGLLQQATRADIPALVAFFNQQAACYQFAPVLTEQWLLNLSGDNGLCLDHFWLLKDGVQIHACLAIWDQRAFKQTVARGYRFPISLLRGAYNVFAGMTGRVQLPAVGEQLEQVFLAFVAVDNLADALAVVREGLARARDKGAEVAVLGLSVANPLTVLLKQSLKPSVYRTTIETVILSDGLAPTLDGRPPQPEVAVL